MSSNSDVWELVHALSKTEKRYFRRYAALRGDSEDLNYLKLFDLLQQQEVFDAEKLLLALDDPHFRKRFSAHKNYLHQLIRKSMRAYNAGRFAFVQIQGLIADGAFLYHKTLYDQSWKMFRKARKLAQKLEHFPALLEIMQWERRLVKRQRQKDRKDQLREIAAEVKASLLKLDRQLEYQDLYEQVYVLLQANPHSGPSGERVLEGIERLPVLQDEQRANSFQAKHFFFQIRIFLAQLRSQAHAAMDWQEKQLVHWEAHPEIRAEAPFRYSTVVANFLSLATFLHKNDRYQEVRPRLEKLSMRSDYETFQVRQQVYFLDLLHYLNAKDYQKGLSLIPGIMRWMSSNRNRLHRSREIAFDFNIAMIGFLGGDTALAMKSLRNILNEGRQSERLDIQAAANLFLRIIYAENEEVELGESQSRSLRRFIRLYYNKGYLVWLVPKLERILSLPKGPAQALAFSQLLSEIREHDDRNGWGIQAGFNALTSWMEIKAGPDAQRVESG